MYLRERIKWLVFPGMNLHARLRWRVLPRYFGAPANGEKRLVLDAGCGNGMLAYRSCQRGNLVIGISIKPGEIPRNRRLFNDFLGLPDDRIRFLEHNLYDVEQLGEQFDEIICTEVLEHIADDRRVCRSFARILKPGGVLHICCPNADHVDNRNEALDAAEAGGHVRAGYTLPGYRQLLEPLGFRITDEIGLGGPVAQACNKHIVASQERLGFLAGVATYLALWPVQLFDVAPRVPYCLYVRAVKASEPLDPSPEVL